LIFPSLRQRKREEGEGGGGRGRPVHPSSPEGGGEKAGRPFHLDGGKALPAEGKGGIKEEGGLSSEGRREV